MPIIITEMENEKVAAELKQRRINGEANEEEEEDGEEQKIEKFYALIRNFHQARSRIEHEIDEKRKNEIEMKMKKSKIRRLNDGEEQSAGWVPSFEWEDFTKEIEFRKTPLISPSATSAKKKLEEHKKQEDDHEGDRLDLKLAL